MSYRKIGITVHEIIVYIEICIQLFIYMYYFCLYVVPATFTFYITRLNTFPSYKTFIVLARLYTHSVIFVTQHIF